MILKVNPFLYSRPVEPSQLLGRERELRRVFDRLAAGQSIAVTGQRHSGKTSILKSIIDPIFRRAHHIDKFDKTFFFFLDALLLRTIALRPEFWTWTLAP